MMAGRLKDLIVIESKSVTRDLLGGEVVSWSTFATCWAACEPLRLREYMASRAAMVEVSMKVSMRYIAGVLPTMRIKVDGDPYPIVSVVDVRNRGKELEILLTGPAVGT
jgi:SPP1 family predicted phage head-tail adaptor